jgi:hypothetical protein
MENDYYYYKRKAKRIMKIIQKLVKQDNNSEIKTIFLINHYNHVLQKTLLLMKYYLES